MKRIALFGAPRTGRTSLLREILAVVAQRGDAVTLEEASEAAVADGCDLTLLMGLDLPGAAQEAEEDARIRARLQAAGRPYQVVYGSGAQRLRSALAAMARAGVLPADAVQREPGDARAWTWVCEKCSDPACEHRLFAMLRS